MEAVELGEAQRHQERGPGSKETGMIPDVVAFLGSSKGYPATKGRAGEQAC